MNNIHKTPDKQTARKAWVDFGRGISMFLVVLFHTETYFPLSNFQLSPWVTSFRIPFFFFLSGYLYTSNHRHFSLRKKTIQILTRIVWTYMIFTTIIVLPKCLANQEPITHGLADILLGRASWFIVSLGLAQAMWAPVIRYTKNTHIYILYLTILLTIGTNIRMTNLGPFPYWLDSAILAAFFVGLGILYRIYQPRINHILPPRPTTFFILLIIYITAITLDTHHLNTNTMIFVAGNHPHFPLAILYSLIGVATTTILVQIVKPIPALCFVGINSLIFYYLNGGLLHTLSIITTHLGPSIPSTPTPDIITYAIELTICLLSCLILALIATIINRYAPALTGDRQALHNLWQKINHKKTNP